MACRKLGRFAEAMLSINMRRLRVFVGRVTNISEMLESLSLRDAPFQLEFMFKLGVLATAVAYGGRSSAGVMFQ